MSHPTLRILAFSPPAVNADVVRVHVNDAEGSREIVGTPKLMRAFAESIIIAIGGGAVKIPMPPRSKAGRKKRSEA